MSVKSQQVTKEARAKRAQAAPAVIARVRGFAGNHTMMREQSPRETFERQTDEAAQRPLGSEKKEQFLRRKCACGAGHSGECEECKKPEAEMLQRAVQRKLSVNEAGDRYEQEADRVADQVLTASTHRPVSGTPPHIQRFDGQSTGRAGTAPASVGRVLASPGSPLGPSLQQDMGRRFGHDFSGVRVHTGAAAEQSARNVNAHAYTVGQDIVFGASRFAPGTHAGRRLLAHELTHVVQQSVAGGVRVGRSDETSGLSPIMVAKSSDKKIMRKGFESTVEICHGVLETRNFDVTKGGLRVVLILKDLDKQIPNCGDFDFWVTLTQSEDWWPDDDIATCEASTGGTRSFSFANLSAGTYYLTISQIFGHPYCCLEGDILVFDEAVSNASTGCTRDKDPSVMDIVHGALDIAGFIPGLGAIPDGINAAIYVVEGDWANAGLSAVAMVPLWGDGVKLGAIAGKSAIRISEKAAIHLGEEGIAKGLKEVKAASKVKKATLETTEEATKLAEKKAAQKTEKEVAEKVLKERIKKCLEIYAAKEALGDCKSCKGTDTPTERAAKIACLTGEIALRKEYLKDDCDDVLQGSIDRVNKGQDPKGGHKTQLAQKIQSLAKCATLPTK